MGILDIEDIKKTTHLHEDNYMKDLDETVVIPFVKEFIEIIKTMSSVTKVEWKQINRTLMKKYSIHPSIVTMNYVYCKLIEQNIIERNKSFENMTKGKQVRENSGITQITVLTSGTPFGETLSCEHNCHFCPDEPAHEGNNYVKQPRSYLKKEPAVMRANQNDFEPHKQLWSRCSALYLCGIKIDKLEVFILGGTWSSYEVDYRIWFCKILYWAANTFYSDKDKRREPLSLEEEIKINETALVRIIGLTPETRPDHMTSEEIRLLRRINATRVQMGVQHTDKYVLSKNNRGCYIEDVIRANTNGKDCGFKLDAHWMPQLYGTTLEKDYEMFEKVLTHPDLQFEQWKIYPFIVTDWTEISKRGDYFPPYSTDDLYELLMHIKPKIPEYIRNNRIIRDIPESYDLIGNHMTNRRDILHTMMKKRNLECRCIRCREPKNKQDAIDKRSTAELNVIHYESCGGDEYFISIDSKDKKYIYGFCRLRLSKRSGWIKNIKPRTRRNGVLDSYEEDVNLMPELNNHALVRELHVYGNMNPVDTHLNSIQHKGFGQKLMKKAEQIAIMNGYFKIAVISGVGVRKYYENKLDYQLGPYDYMYKSLYKSIILLFVQIIIVLIIVVRSYQMLDFHKYHMLD